MFIQSNYFILYTKQFIFRLVSLKHPILQCSLMCKVSINFLYIKRGVDVSFLNTSLYTHNVYRNMHSIYTLHTVDMYMLCRINRNCLPPFYAIFELHRNLFWNKVKTKINVSIVLLILVLFGLFDCRTNFV